MQCLVKDEGPVEEKKILYKTFSLWGKKWANQRGGGGGLGVNTGQKRNQQGYLGVGGGLKMGQIEKSRASESGWPSGVRYEMGLINGWGGC